MQNDETEPLPYTTYIITLKMIKDFNVRPETKTPRQNIGKMILEIGLGNNFFDMTPTALVAKAKISKWD